MPGVQLHLPVLMGLTVRLRKRIRSIILVGYVLGWIGDLLYLDFLRLLVDLAFWRLLGLVLKTVMLGVSCLCI